MAEEVLGVWGKVCTGNGLTNGWTLTKCSTSTAREQQHLGGDVRATNN